MGYAVLHVIKANSHDEIKLSAHIERTVHPDNADKERTYLNRELVEYPEGVTNRTQAIQNRLDNAGLKRKIGKNQVRSLCFLLSGTHEDMLKIEEDGKLDEWCNDSLNWIKDTFGKENLVSAVLHRDELTPHIHVTVVPIVSGERRKVKNQKPEEENPGKKKYKKRSRSIARLCADDLISRNQLKEYQTTYAERMSKYGLERGVDGSKARHISTVEYYRELYTKNEDLQEDIKYLQEEKQEVYEKIRDMYDRKDEAQEKFSSLDSYLKQKEEEVGSMESRISQLSQEYEPYKAQEDLNLLLDLFPSLNERLRIAQLCKGIGLAVDSIRQLFKGEAVTITGKLHSSEHDQLFSVQNSKLQLFAEHDNPNKLGLSINGKNIIDWFKEKYQELKQAVQLHIKPQSKSEVNQSKGIKR